MWVLGCNSRPRYQNLEIQKTRNTPYPEEQQESTNANAENQKETRNIRFKSTSPQMPVWSINQKETQKKPMIQIKKSAQKNPKQ